MQQPPDIHWPWWPFELGSLTDLAGIVVGLVGLAVSIAVFLFTKRIARRQLDIMRKQTKMMKEQNAAARRIEDLTLKQGALAERQTELAEEQNKIVKHQLERQPDMSVVLRPLNPAEDEEPTQYEILISNHGTRGSGIFRWHLLIPDGTEVPKFEDGKRPGAWVTREKEISYRHYSDTCVGPVFKYHQELIGTITAARNSTTVMLWQVVSDDGEWPGVEEYGRLALSEWDKHLMRYILHKRSPLWKHVSGLKSVDNPPVETSTDVAVDPIQWTV